MATLSNWRREQALDVATAAKLLGVSKGALTKWERGERTPRPAMGRVIVARTGGAVTLQDLYSPEPGAALPLPPAAATPHSGDQAPPGAETPDQAHELTA